MQIYVNRRQIRATLINEEINHFLFKLRGLLKRKCQRFLGKQIILLVNWEKEEKVADYRTLGLKYVAARKQVESWMASAGCLFHWVHRLLRPIVNAPEISPEEKKKKSKSTTLSPIFASCFTANARFQQTMPSFSVSSFQSANVTILLLIPLSST